MESNFEYAIIGAGISGAYSYFLLSQFASCILIDEHAAIKQMHLLKVVPAHGLQFIPDVPKENQEIFQTPHYKTIYASNTLEAPINGMDFGQPFGTIMSQDFFIKWCLDHANSEKSKILLNHRVSAIHISSEMGTLQLEKTTNSSELKQISAQVIILATGSYGIELQKSLGFNVPEIFNAIILTAQGPIKQLKQNCPVEYIYRLHPKVSTEGPLAVTRGNNTINLAYISKETPAEMTEKFIRLIRNYKPLQTLLDGTDKNPQTISDADFIHGKCGKYPISPKVKNRVIVIGEASGIMTPVYYEGVLGCFASAFILAKTLKQLKEQNSHYSAADLHSYEEEFQTQLRNYMRSAAQSEGLFLKSGSSQFVIWNSYLECIIKLHKLRKNIHWAYISDDLANYPVENDEWGGEEIYKNLPLTQKLLLTPLFLKAKFS